MTGMDDLVTWLRAQLDDDERVVIEDREDGEQPTFPYRQLLADIEAKREMLDSLASDLADDSTDDTAQWRVRLLARPHAGRPGWRPEWGDTAQP